MIYLYLTSRTSYYSYECAIARAILFGRKIQWGETERTTLTNLRIESPLLWFCLYILSSCSGSLYYIFHKIIMDNTTVSKCNDNSNFATKLESRTNYILLYAQLRKDAWGPRIIVCALSLRVWYFKVHYRWSIKLEDCPLNMHILSTYLRKYFRIF